MEDMVYFNPTASEYHDTSKDRYLGGIRLLICFAVL